MFNNRSSIKQLLVTGICVMLAFSACVSTPPSTAMSAGLVGGADRPAWVNDVYSGLDRNRYVAALGTGRDVAQAEKSAYANLTDTFGQAIQVSDTAITSYHQVVSSAAAARWTESSSLESVIQTSASLDILLGTEIRERYNDRSGWYAVAVMDKPRATSLYNEVIRANLAMIERLTNMNQAEKNSLEGFTRYHAAATVADINVSYGNVLRAIGSPLAGEIRDGSGFRFEATGIAATIPISVNVSGDRNNRIRDAFAGVLAEQGFRSGGTGSRYQIQAELSLEPVEVANPNNVFSRAIINANFIDSNTNAVLIPFNINQREGHRTTSEAENRAIALIERRIKTEYSQALQNYLSQLKN